jgi:hypothetical protein
MARFTTKSFTTDTVSAGGTLDYEMDVLANTLDIAKIKVVASGGAKPSTVQIYRASARPISDLLYTTRSYDSGTFVEPTDDSLAEKNEGWICPYFDKDESMKMHWRFINGDDSDCTYSVTIIYESSADDSSGVVGAPEGLIVQAIANGLFILSGVIATKNNSTITEAEFRAKRLDPGAAIKNQDLRLVSEGGTFVPDGVNNLSVTGIVAGPGGAQYSWTSESQGRWYYTWRLKNSVGWSRWSDGNVTPRNVPHWVKTQEYSDDGAPADWTVWIEPGPSNGYIIVHATRPRVNGNNLLWWVIQIKDADTGSWQALDSGASPTEVLYDGSAVAHTLSDGATRISKVSGGWGTGQGGDLILLDVRGGDFDVNHCQWGLVDRIDGSALVFSGPGWRPQVTTDLRLKIVKPPWKWTGSGYLGNEANHGMWGQNTNANNGLGEGWILGRPDAEFISEAIVIPTSITNPEARVWFENMYCRSDDNTRSTGMSGGTGLFSAPITFTDFSNRDYWLPVYPPSTWGTLTFPNSGGYVTMACKSGNAQYHYGYSGIRARFRLHPDANGTFTVYAKFTDVTFPVGANSTDQLLLGVVLIPNLFLESTAGFGTTGVATIINGTSATNLYFDAPYIRYRVNPTYFPTHPVQSDANPIYYVGSTAIARADVPNGSIFEMKCYFKKAASYYYSANDPIQYQVGGSGGWKTKTSTWPREGVKMDGGGVELFIGWVGNCRLAGATAKLVQVDIETGLGEFF